MERNDKGPAWPPLRLFDPVAFQLAAQGAEADLEQPGRLGFVLRGLVVNLQDMLFFQLVQRQGAFCGHGRRGWPGARSRPAG